MAILFRASPTLLFLLIFRMIHADRPTSKKNSTLGQDDGTIVISRSLRGTLHFWILMSAVVARAEKEHRDIPSQTHDFQLANAELLKTVTEVSDEDIENGLRINKVAFPPIEEITTLDRDTQFEEDINTLDKPIQAQTFIRATSASNFNASSIDEATLHEKADDVGLSEEERDVLMSGMSILREVEVERRDRALATAKGGGGGSATSSSGTGSGSTNSSPGTARASSSRARFSSKNSNTLTKLSRRPVTPVNLRNYWFYLIISHHAAWMSDQNKEGAENFEDEFADEMCVGGGYHAKVWTLMINGDDVTAHVILGKIIDVANEFSKYDATKVPADVTASYDDLNDQFDTRFGDKVPEADSPPIPGIMFDELIGLNDAIIQLYDIAMATFSGAAGFEFWRRCMVYVSGVAAAVLAAKA